MFSIELKRFNKKLSCDDSCLVQLFTLSLIKKIVRHTTQVNGINVDEHHDKYPN